MPKIAKNQISYLGLVVGLVLFFDQLTKILVLKSMHWGQSIEIIPFCFALTYVKNTGAAFGFLADAAPAFRKPFFVIVPLLVTFFILYAYFKTEVHQKWVKFSYALIVGGAIGNMIDRFRLGFVVDFLDFHLNYHIHWPAFNIADSCIVVGIGSLMIETLFFQKKLG